MDTGPRLIWSGTVGISVAGLTYFAVKKWNLGTNRREEIALFGGLAAAVIAYLLLGGATATPATEQPASSGGGAAPYQPTPFVYGPGNLTLNLTREPDHGNCDCGCGQLNPQLTSLFNDLAKKFAATLTADQQSIYTAQMAAVPNWLADYGKATLLGETDLIGLNIFSPAGPTSDIINKPIAPGVYESKVWG